MGNALSRMRTGMITDVSLVTTRTDRRQPASQVNDKCQTVRASSSDHTWAPPLLHLYLPWEHTNLSSDWTDGTLRQLMKTRFNRRRLYVSESLPPCKLPTLARRSCARLASRGLGCMYLTWVARQYHLAGHFLLGWHHYERGRRRHILSQLPR